MRFVTAELSAEEVLERLSVLRSSASHLRQLFQGERLRARELRLNAMQAQLKTALNRCTTAKTMIVLGNRHFARDSVERVEHSIQFLQTRLKEPNHVPADSVPDIRGQIVQLERELLDLKGRFK